MSEKARKNAGINLHPVKDKDISDWINVQNNYGLSIKTLIRKAIKQQGNVDIFQVAYDSVTSEPVQYITSEPMHYVVPKEKSEPVKVVPAKRETKIKSQEEEEADSFDI